MKLGSLFDGSGTCPLAATLCGIEPVWASEIEPYPIKVTTKNFPQMKHLGDITLIKGKEIEPVDIITFGSPCQDLSVAGKRVGIHEGQRSSLFFHAIRIIKEMREETNGKYPRYAIWENVPGAFSSNRGRDFLAVLQAFCEVAGGYNVPEPTVRQGKLQWSKDGCIMGDGFSLAWRMLDAQYWGVPQRRKRIYLVADFAGGRAPEILFKREGLSGNSAESGTAREGATTDATGSAGGSRDAKCLNRWDCTLSTQTDQRVCYPRVARTLTAEADASFCIDRGQNVVCVQNTGRGWWNQGDIAETLRTPTGGDSTKANLVVMCYDARGNGDGTHCPTLTGDHENRVTDYTALCVSGYQSAALDGRLPRKYIIRRLTPLECCRLQGFPDWWEEGIEGSDTARYKMWGNGMALPCVLYVMQGIIDCKEAVV